tara:strand:+ start:70 stop:231 length:162 start_codon:yes stop_codon:yes gene_type:complete
VKALSGFGVSCIVIFCGSGRAGAVAVQLVKHSKDAETYEIVFLIPYNMYNRNG